MHSRWIASISVLVVSTAAWCQRSGDSQLPKSASGILVSVNSSEGTYEIAVPSQQARLTGKIESKVSHVSSGKGKDGVGAYQEIRFDWNTVGPVQGTIRRYDNLPVVWFRLRYLEGEFGAGIPFPILSGNLSEMKTFSYQDRTFAPPKYGLAETATPWLLFEPNGQSMIMSPASEFMIAKMFGNEKTSLGVRLNEGLKSIPKNMDQDALLVFGDGIGHTWDTWGLAMRGLYKRTLNQPNADVLVQKFGYWTDNGADYYYNYDLKRGYTNTLLDLKKTYDAKDIPLGYLQLDSWWYQKSINDPSGKPGGVKKNSKLPEGNWNRYGGLMEYRADPELFPTGLGFFQHDLGIPLATHNRWIDRTSPYHQTYLISGVGAVELKWWDDIMEYLLDGGVVCYEQDWLDQIYLNSPEMGTMPGIGDAFTDGMAKAAKNHNLTLQYCMGTPRFFLQGLKYPNLTTIRTSGDRFEPGKWADFIYVSQLADSVGILPWCDVFKSGELGNMILSVLSAGPVGTGDSIGKENASNIFKAILPDGVIVKPDRPILPMDQTYQDGADHRKTPFLASTYTNHGTVRTSYVFAFPRDKSTRHFEFNLRDLGQSGAAYVFDFAKDQSTLVGSDGVIQGDIGEQGYAYLMVLPVTQSGITILGDLSKIVPTGKQRIVSIDTRSTGLSLKIHFAPGESRILIEGICPSLPTVTAIKGSAKLESYDSTTGRFVLGVLAVPSTHSAEFTIAKSGG